MIDAHNGSQGRSCISPYVPGNPTATRKNRCHTWRKAGEALGVHRIRPCRLPPNFIFCICASAAKWL